MYCTPRLARSRPLAGFAASPLSSFVAEFMAPAATCDGSETCRLPIDIQEKDGTFILTASVPGFKKDEVSVSFHEGVLTIEATKAEKAESTSEEGGATWHRRERRLVNLARSIRLPDSVNGEGIAAAMTDGVLTVTVPQVPAGEKKKIAVN